MNILTIFLVLAIIGIAFWLVSRYVPGIWRTIFQVALGLVLLFFILKITGVLEGVGSLRL